MVKNGRSGARVCGVVELAHLDSTRLAYDTVAARYAQVAAAALAELPLNRAMLNTFAELVRAHRVELVADVGCGPGHVAAHLHSLGVDVIGVDLSPAMVELARQSYPELRFEVGSMTSLDLPDGALGGIVAWYSIIHLPPEQLARAFAEFHRVLVPGGQLLLAFQVGDERLHITQAFGHAVSVDAYRLPPDGVGEQLAMADFEVHARLLREPGPSERVRQAYLLARKAV